MVESRTNIDQPKGLKYIAEFAPDSSNDAKLLEKVIEIARRPPREINKKAG